MSDSGASHPDPGSKPEPDSGRGPKAFPADNWQERREAMIADLRSLIFAQGKWGKEIPAPPQDPTNDPTHDPALRHRMEAVEVLGLFPDLQAAQLLRELLLLDLRSEVAGIPARWLRNTALLTLLRSKRLPSDLVDKALREEYAFWHHVTPWEWGEVYEELPLLRRHGKLGIFVRAFWSWPLFLLGLPTLLLVYQIIYPQDLTVGGSDPAALLSLAATLGAGLELYLVHQVLVEWVAGRNGELLRFPGKLTPLRKLVAWIVSLILVVVMLALFSGRATTAGSWEAISIQFASLALPFFLVPMFVLSHDLDMAARYRLRTTARLPVLGAALARMLTVLTYAILPLVLFGGVWTFELSDEALRLLALAYLAYLFLFVPLAWMLGSRPGRRVERTFSGGQQTTRR